MADKVFNIKFNVDANVSPITGALNGLKQSLSGLQSNLKFSDAFTKGFGTTFSKLEAEIKKYESITNKGFFSNMKEIQNAQKSYEEILRLFNQLQSEATHLKGIDPKKLLPPEALKNTQDLEKAWQSLGKTIQEIESKKAIKSGLETRLKELQELQKLENGKDLKRSLSYWERQQNKGPLTSGDTEKLKAAETAYKRLIELRDKYTAGEKAAPKQLNDSITKTTQDIDKLTNSLNGLKAIKDSGLSEIQRKLAEISGVSIDKVPTSVEGLAKAISQLNGAQFKELAKDMEKLGIDVTKFKSQLAPIEGNIRKAFNDGGAIRERERDLQRLADRAKYFFSITNSIQLFKRTVRSAFNTIKELDAVMTQAAVVTKFDVGDMWSQLPEYTKRASELGVSVKGAYEAATLYYQQGLETDQVIGVSNETLKMAKIAGMEYATATDYMTSALRGFNMEVNEASAQRVNDVYSQLAAKSASNTEELSIAMSKTAPLAHNAGMEIESTAAILANMIETTREAPETLGTAMKTVIARFQELKKSPDQIGEVEGEIVDANKIETALKSIGVALRDSQGQFRDFDDVIFDISAKWDSLDKNTQRYIATIAAGSRQQSRFIAMVGDYDRTMELVEMANNSAGASEAQFAKTQDSLASKLERLKNAWAEFTMGIANNQIIKAAVDALTGLINVINKLTAPLGSKGAGGVLKSILNTAELIAGIKIARAALNGFFAFILKTSKTTGVAAGANIGTGMAAGLRGASLGNKFAAILTPVATTKAAMFSKGIGKQFAAEVASMNAAATTAAATAAAKQTRMVDAATTAMRTTNVGGLGRWAVQAEYSAAYIAASKAATAADAERSASLSQVLASYNKLTAGIVLNEEQTAFANSLQEYGIVGDEARAIAVMNLTETEIAEAKASAEAAAAKLGQNKVSQEAIGLAIKEAASKKALAQAELMSAKGRMKNNAALVFGTKGMRQAAQTTRETAGMSTKLSTALAGLPISLGAILGIIAAIAATIAIIHHFSLGEQIERAEKATQKATESAKEAQEAYDNLLSGQETYNELQNKLSELTYGTKEFTQALLEANTQVLDLINTYSGLEFEIGEYGQLVIKESSWENALTEANNKALASQNLVLSRRENSEKLKEQQREQLLLNSYIDKINKEEKLSATQQYNAIQALNALKKGTNINEIEKNNFLGTEAYNIIQEYSSQLNAIRGSSKVEIETSRQARILSTIGETKNKELISSIIENNYDEYLQQFIKTIKPGKQVTINDLQKAYMDTFNASKKDIKGMTYDELAEGLFSLQTEDLGKNIENAVIEYKDKIPGIIDALSGEMTDEYSKFFEGFGLDLEDFVNLDNTELEDKLRKILLESGVSLNDLAKNFGYVFEDGSADIDGFLNHLKQGVADAEQEWSQLQENFKGTFKEIFENSLSEGLPLWDSIQKNFNKGEKRFYIGMVNSMAENFGTKSSATKKFAIGMHKLIQSQGVEQVKKSFGDLDLSDPIKAFNQYQEKISETEQEVEKLKGSLGELPHSDKEIEKLQENVNKAKEQYEREKEGKSKTNEGRRPLVDTLNMYRGALSENSAVEQQNFQVISSIEEANERLEFMHEQLNDNAFSAKELLSSFYLSGGLEKISDDLKEVADASGHITGKDLEGLRGSSEELDEFLKTSIVSANGLALAINGIGDGAPLQGFTSSVLAAIDKVAQLKFQTTDFFNYIDSFTPDRSEDETFDTFGENYDKYKQLLGKNLYADSAAISYFDFYTGENTEINNLGNGRKEMDAVNKEWKRMIDTASKFDTSIAEVQKWGKTFGFDKTGKTTKTIDDVLELLGEDFQYAGNEAKRGFLEDWLSHTDVSMRRSLEQNTIRDSIETEIIPSMKKYTSYQGLGRGTVSDLEGQQYAFISNAEIQSYAKAAGVQTDSVIAQIKESLGEGVELIITPTIEDETGNPLTGQQVVEQLTSQFEESDLSLTDFLKDEGVITPEFNDDGSLKGYIGDLEKLQQLAGEINVDPEVLQSGLEGLEDVEINFKASDDDVAQVKSIAEEIEKGFKESMSSASEEAQAALDSVSTAHVVGELDNAKNAANDMDSAITNACRDRDIKITPELTKNSLDVVINFVKGTMPNGEARKGTAKFRPDFAQNTKAVPNISKGNIGFKNSSNFSFSAFARGSKYGGLKKSQYALTGEEGPELAYDEDGAFFLGQNGPEVAFLKKGTVIYSNPDTKEIMRGHSYKGKMNNFVKPSEKSDFMSSSPSSGSTSGGVSKPKPKASTPKANAKSATKSIKEAKDETEKWENSLDFIYNLLEEINKQARVREKLEKRYQKLLKDNKSSLKDIRDITRQQLANLSAQRASEEERIRKREEEMRDTLDKNKDLEQYLQYDFETQMINVDWDKVNAISDKDTGEAFEEFKSEVERIRDDIWDAEDSIEDIDDAVDEINERGRDQRKELEERIIDALKQQREQQIEEQENLNKTIEDANSKLIDSIDANISQMRKDREREKTRTDLEDKERRLAYMRQDTTGGNAVAIKQLEKELNDAKESYVDTLVDDRLQEIKNQNEEARAQREKQIELMKSRLEYDEKHGLLADKANEMISEFIQKYGNKENFSVADTEIYKLLSDIEGTEAMGIISKAEWAKELKSALKVINQPGADVTPEDYMEYMRGEAKLEDKNLFRKYETERNKIVEDKTAFTSSYDKGMKEKIDPTKDYMKDINAILAKNDEDLTRGDWENLFKLAGLRDQKIAGLDLDSLPYEIDNPDTLAYILKKFAERYTLGAYATGGLVDKTGPAWLDGTKTRPEMVLNAQQTAAFIQLKDILSQLNLSGSTPTSDNYNFDIDIHVDQISNDYDVDRMAEQLERSLYEKAMYRNVNSLRFMK